MAHDFSEAHHLPSENPDGLPADPEGLPRQRRGTTPQMHGRYPDYDVLEQAGHWDEVTRRVVLARVEQPPPIRFFDEREAPTLTAFCDCVTAQDREPRIPVLAFVDEKLFEGKLDGWQFEDMPDDGETWRRVARGLDEAARELPGIDGFGAATLEMQNEICERFAGGELGGGVWETLPCARAWSVVMRATLAAFYAHPWAWNEIGFGGPAYPRGYARLGLGMREAWEGDEAFDLDPVKDTQERGLE